MKQIIIHCRNEEIERIEPLAEKLRKQGAAVRYLAIKWRERDPKAEVALCPENLLEVVENMYDGHPNCDGKKVQVRVLEADVMAPAEPQPEPLPVAVKVEAASITLNLDGHTPAITVSDSEPVVARDVKTDEIRVPASDEIVMRVGEQPAAEKEEEAPKPAPAPRRRK